MFSLDVIDIYIFTNICLKFYVGVTYVTHKTSGKGVVNKMKEDQSFSFGQLRLDGCVSGQREREREMLFKCNTETDAFDLVCEVRRNV